MPTSLGRSRRRAALALGCTLAFACTSVAQPGGCPTLPHLQRLSHGELRALFENAEVGTPPVGKATGKLLTLDDRHPRLKVALVNSVWRGKVLACDGTYINRWAAGVRALESQYVLGTSWLDGRPAIIMEYPAGTPLFANLRDEIREVAPGLYLGPMYERAPCPKLLGFVALRLEPCRCRRVTAGGRNIP